MYNLFVSLVLFICSPILVPCDAVLFDLFKEPFSNSYDFIVVGAGSAGGVIGSRLSENPKWNILLLEAGVDGNYFTDIPLSSWLQSVPPYDWGFKCEKTPKACLGTPDKTCLIAKGKAVGGTSVTSFMVYSRGNRWDWDEWKELGNDGWGFEDVLPYFKKSENCSLCINANINPEYHNTSGPLNVEPPGFQTPIVDLFIKAGELMGYNETDPTGPTQLGFSKVLTTERNGRKCSTAKAFINPALSRSSNLHLSKSTVVTKILIDPTTKQAYGVNFVKNGITYTVNATKEVILSAGSINSPHLLMLSGVGPKEHLEDKGITCLKNLSVGFNMQDHIGIVLQALFVNESVTINELTALNPTNIYEYNVEGKGPFTLPGGAEALAFVKSKYAAASSPRPDLELVLGATSFNFLTLGLVGPFFGISTELYLQVFAKYVGRPSFSINPFILRPKSRGRVSLRDKDPLVKPVIEPNYLDADEDLATLVEGMKIVVQIAESDPFKRYDTQINKSPFPGCENLIFGSDEYWACVVRQVGQSEQHHVGTCKMGPSTDTEAVVDSKLRVYGIKGLRVADASICPVIIAGHTNAVAIMIGEKAADIIKSDYNNM